MYYAIARKDADEGWDGCRWGFDLPGVAHRGFIGRDDVAFAHALRLALAAHAEFSIIHVTRPCDIQAEEDWVEFPRIRQALGR